MVRDKIECLMENLECLILIGVLKRIAGHTYLQLRETLLETNYETLLRIQVNNENKHSSNA